MFHLQYPASKDFMTWNELACLCRALGFPGDLFKKHIHNDSFGIKFDELGMEVKNVQRAFDLNLLYQALHLTYNMHTADWNTRTMSKAMHMLGHRVLDFERLYNLKVAYMAYEHIDMKGMKLDRQILLRTLKMCGLVISPLKLVNRVKHMKSQFEEQGRIQLYELLDFILWCDLVTRYNQDDMEASGMDGDLFQLVDFNKLLSHHDERVIKALNARYLRDEMNFGMEQFGPKEMFKELTVNEDFRREQVQYHKENYFRLKNEVNQSQNRVYQAHAGSIRPRPISAPDLDKYRQKKEYHEPLDIRTLLSMESAQRRIHSTCSRETTRSCSYRPHTGQDIRSSTPQAVTPKELHDMHRKMENLQFDINTLDTRCQIQVENEMMFYIPRYLEMLSSRKQVTETAQLPKEEKKHLHWTREVVKNHHHHSSNNGSQNINNQNFRSDVFLKHIRREITKNKTQRGQQSHVVNITDVQLNCSYPNLKWM